MNNPRKTAAKEYLERKKRTCKIYVDLENFYYSPELKSVTIRSNRFDYIKEIIDNVIRMIEDTCDCRVKTTQVYGDLIKMAMPMEVFSNSNVELRFVYSTDRKNSSDIDLCIDVVSGIYIHPENEIIVLFTGDRDFMSLVKKIQTEGKLVFIVSFENSISGDLKELVGEDFVLNAIDYLDPDNQNKIKQYMAYQETKEKERAEKLIAKADTWAEKVAQSDPSPRNGTSAPNGQTSKPIVDNSSKSGTCAQKIGPAVDAERLFSSANGEIKRLNPDQPYHFAAVSLAMTMRRELRANEIWLTPFLRRMTDKFPNLSSGTRKSIISCLEKCGIIAIAESQISVDTNKFSVLVVNDQHPDVIHLQSVWEAKQARREEIKARLEREQLEIPPDFDKNGELTIRDMLEQTPDVENISYQERDPFEVFDIKEYSKIFEEKVFRENEVWVKCSEIGVRVKKHTLANFKDLKLAMEKAGIIKLRGVGGNHEMALMKRISD
jgi:uncharacterized LabA/DUF88 family protein